MEVLVKKKRLQEPGHEECEHKADCEEEVGVAFIRLIPASLIRHGEKGNDAGEKERPNEGQRVVCRTRVRRRAATSACKESVMSL